MPRAKLEMKLIENLKKRKATYKNRRDGLVQKISQLSTLCTVDAFLICFDLKAAGTRPEGGAAVTTWPADHEAVLELVTKYRETPPDKLHKILDTPTFYQQELEKQQHRLLKVHQCGAGDKLAPWHSSLDDFSVADLNAVVGTLDETLQKVQQRIAALGGGHVVVRDEDMVVSASAAAVAAAPMSQSQMPGGNTFDVASGSSLLPETGAMLTQYCYPPPHDMVPQPFPIQQAPCLLGAQMPPPYLSYEMPPQTLVAPLDFVPYPYTTNVVNGVASGYYDDLLQGFGAGGAYVDDDVLEQAFAAGPDGAGYDFAHHMTAGAWPVGRRNYPMDGAAFQLKNDFAGPGSCSNSSFQGGFQN